MAMEEIHVLIDVKLLLLLGCANTMPIVAFHIFKDRFSAPIDLGRNFIDGRPIFGPHKTWRGLVASVLGTWLAALILHVDFAHGVLLALWSMVGDMIASFIKRRLGLKSGARCTGIDQAIESLLPLVILKGSLGITWPDCFIVTALFVFLEIVLSPFFYKIGFRKNPY